MKVTCSINRLGAPMRAIPFVGKQNHAAFRCVASRDAEMKQMAEFKAGLAKKLESTSSPSASVAPAADGERDLPLVELDDYWTAVEELSSNDTLLVMDFFTQWCGPCKLIKPTLCDWSEELAGKVNFRKFECSKENAPVGKAVAVKSVPTFIVYKNNEEVGRVVGKQEAKLRALIDENM